MSKYVDKRRTFFLKRHTGSGNSVTELRRYRVSHHDRAYIWLTCTLLFQCLPHSAWAAVNQPELAQHGRGGAV